jgi:acetolactate synthase-1/2/3 large subunit
MDRAPMVVITGQAGTNRMHKESHQHMDVVSLFRPITKWAQSVQHAVAIPEIVRKAFKTAQAEKPGAVLIELPEDLAAAEVEGAPLVAQRTRRAGADHKAVAQAVAAIVAARNPIVLAGNGAIRKRASRQLCRFAELTGIGVANTFMGKGAVPRSDPHCLYTIGLQGGDYVNLAIDESDLVIAVGYDLVEYGPAYWNRGTPTPVVHIDFAPAETDHAYPVAVEVVADIADALWQINEQLSREHGERLPLFDVARRANLRATITDDLAAEADDAGFPVKPQRILNDLRATMAPSDIVLSDVGAHKMWVARYYQCDEPNTCLISNGFCAMGFALPGAIGAKLAHPERRVVAVCGDAGFLMNVQELETAVRLGLAIVVMVWVDGEYGLIKWKQQNQFAGRHSDLAFNNPDFVKLAEAFGMWGRVIDGPGQIGEALAEAFAQRGPALVAVPVDYAENHLLTERLGNLVCPI